MAADDTPDWPDRLPSQPSQRGQTNRPAGRSGPGGMLQPSQRLRLARNIAIGGGLAGYSWVAADSVPFSTRALLSVLLPGALVGLLAYGWPRRQIEPPESLDIAGFSYWIICIAVLLEWEAAAFRDNSRWWHPSLTDLVNPLITPHPLRTVAFLLWLLTGWGLVRR